MTGLPVSRLINVSVNLSPQAAQGANLNALLILGASDVIDTNERMRAYASISEVADDFGTSAPEYLAALLYYEQAPQPQTLFIGRWAKTATKGLLRGGILNAEELLYDFNTISAGAMNVTVDGVVKNLTALNFSAVLNFNGVASIITTALAGSATCTWDGSRFQIESATTGTSSTVSFASNVGGVHLATLMLLTSTTASPLVVGIPAEEPVDAVDIFVDRFSTQWFGLMFADTSLTDDQILAVSAFIEADQLHMYGITETSTQALDSTVTDDIGSQIKALNRLWTVTSYSSSNPYAVASLFGRAFSVNFNGNNTTITLMYKQEPGIVAETLSSSQANVLKAKRYNVFVNYNNDTAIIQYGTMAGPAYFDDMHNLAWLRNRVQTDVYNLLYTSPTKIPQTDAGNHIIETTIESGLIQGVNNGMIAPGQWNSGGFGTLNQGDFLPKGYYIFVPEISTQAQSDREARKSVPFQVAVKLAGAIHTVDIIINVNR